LNFGFNYCAIIELFNNTSLNKKKEDEDFTEQLGRQPLFPNSANLQREKYPLFWCEVE